MYTIGVVILNYIAYQTTIETMNSFLKQDKDGFDIKYVIVDNASPNNSYDELKIKYEDYSNIFVIKTEKNLGFAKGNNYGYKELTKHFTPDFVIVSNDDIVLPEDKLFSWISKTFEKYHYAVIGPDVYSVNGKFHQSPLRNKTRDLNKLKKEKKSLFISIIKSYVKHMIRYSTYTGIPKWSNDLYHSFSEELTLHGSFQIFSKKYFEAYELPYDSSTFLYMEEDILKLRCDKKNLKMVYDPSYHINHLQAVSTNMINSNASKKELFRYKNLLKSLNVYIDEVKK